PRRAEHRRHRGDVRSPPRHGEPVDRGDAPGAARADPGGARRPAQDRRGRAGQRDAAAPEPARCERPDSPPQAPLMDCLDGTDLLALVDGSLPAVRRERSEHHLRECDTCRRVVAALAELQGGRGWDTSTGPVAAHSALDLLAVGTSLGRYELRERIGIGGAGGGGGGAHPPPARRGGRREGEHGEETAGRLRAEAQALARVRDPHVVTVHEVSTLGDQVFMTMELVEGGTLAAWLRAERRRWKEVLDVFRRAGQGLS